MAGNHTAQPGESPANWAPKGQALHVGANAKRNSQVKGPWLAASLESYVAPKGQTAYAGESLRFMTEDAQWILCILFSSIHREILDRRKKWNFQKI